MKSNKPLGKLRYYQELAKLKINIPVSLTGMTGYFLFYPSLSKGLFLVTTGILLFAVSASILNQLQEVHTDAKMDRTRNRPLPSGKISILQAIVFMFFSFVAGSVFVLVYGNTKALLVCFLTVFWYNGVYTPLKRVTPFAVIPGALTGALPPLIGWMAAGGGPLDKTIILIQVFIFVGQIPHFWLFILKYGHQYEKAGLPSLTSIMDNLKISRLVFAWIIATALATSTFWYFGVLHNRTISAILIAASLLLVGGFVSLAVSGASGKGTTRYSAMLNFFVLLVMILLISDRLISFTSAP